MDIFTPQERSSIMAKIRSTGGKAEVRLYVLVAQILKRRRVHRNYKLLPGSPDLYVPSVRLAIFLDGCFFHSCPTHGHIPKSNSDYWKPKLERNQKRDKAICRLLRSQGISVIRFWEHDLKETNLARVTARLERVIRGRLSVGQSQRLAALRQKRQNLRIP